MKNEIVFQKTAIMNTTIVDRIGVPKLFERWKALPEALGGVLIEDKSSVALGELDTVWRFETEEDAAIAVALLSQHDIFAEVTINEEKTYILYWPGGKLSILHGITVASATEAAGLKSKDTKPVQYWREERTPSMKWDALNYRWTSIFPEAITMYCEAKPSSFGELVTPLTLQDVLQAVNAEKGGDPLILSDVESASWFTSDVEEIKALGLYNIVLNNKVTIKVWVVKAQEGSKP